MGAHHKRIGDKHELHRPQRARRDANHDAATAFYLQPHHAARQRPGGIAGFHTRILGMTLVRKSDYEGGKFSLYFLAMLRGAKTSPLMRPSAAAGLRGKAAFWN